MTLELHRAVAKRLLDEPEAVLAVVQANAGVLRSRIQGAAVHADLDEWTRLVGERRLGPIIDVMLGTDARSISMRQTSPFRGVLSRSERTAAIERASP